MKKYIVLAAVALLCGSAFAQGTVPATFSATVAGSVWTNDHFDNVGGSLLIGAQTAVDLDRSLFARVTYHRVNYGAVPLQSLDLQAIEYWYLGNKWSFYVTPGVAVGVAEGTGNNLFFGAGCERLLFTAKTEGYTVPFSLLAYGDLSLADHASQITVGLRFTKPQK